jgi:hypothetical protein
MQPARDPILTRSRAAAAREDNGNGSQPVAVKEEPAELPIPADNGKVTLSRPFPAEGQGVFWSFGAPFARWFASEEESEDDMEGSSMGVTPSKVVKFTGSNRVMTVTELKNWVYQRTLAGGSKRSHTAHTMTQVERFGVLRDCCDGEARVLLHDHFQTRLERNREQYEATELTNQRREAQTLEAWQRAYEAYEAEQAAREQARAQAAQAARGAAPAPASGAGAADAPASAAAAPAAAAPAAAVVPVALSPLQPPVYHAAPKKPPPDDPTIMTDAYALLERTFPEVTPDVYKMSTRGTSSGRRGRRRS